MKRWGVALLGLFLLAPLLAAAVIVTLGSQAAESCGAATTGAGGAGGVGSDTSVEAALQGGAADSLTSAQRGVVARIIAEGRRRQIPTKGIVTAVTVAGAESRFRVYANDGRGGDLRADQQGVDRSLALPHHAVGSDHGSLGVFQQQWPWWGSMRELMDPGASAGRFYAALVKVPRWESLSVSVVAQRVQRSALPSAYAGWESFATSVVAQTAAAPSPESTIASASAGVTEADTKAGFGPEAKRAAAAVRSRFGFTGAIYGYRNDPDSKHHLGLAIDVMTTERALGDRIAGYFIKNRAAFHVDNILWRQRITNAGRGWTFDPMEDRGSATANHYDHVHVDFLGTPDVTNTGGANLAPVAGGAVAPGDGQAVADASGCVPCPTDGEALPASTSALTRGGGVDTALTHSLASAGSTTVDGEKVSMIAAKQLQLAERASGIDLTVMQGGYADQAHYGASGSSHDYPGVVDVSPGSVQVETLLRRYGFAAWARNIAGRPQVGKGAHVHAVSLLDPGDRRSPQVYGSWAGHKDGLGGGPGSDPAPQYPWVAGLAKRVGGVELAPSSGDPGAQSVLQPAAAQCIPGTDGGGSLSALAPAGGPSYELATFNILGANHHRGAPWRTRLAATKSLLAKHGVDVAALQEVHPPQSNALRGLLGGTYARFHTARRPDNQLIWRRDMFTLDRTRSRMLSIPYFGGQPKPMPMVRLVHKATGRGAWYIGVHNPADVHGPAAAFRARAVHMELQAARAAAAATGEPVYLLGDMNDKQRFATMIRGQLRSAMVPGYTGIDWITQTSNGTAGRAAVDDSPLADLASDHPIVVARVATGASTVPVASSTSSPRERWAADVRTAMRGANTYIAGVAATTRRPALNLDIDNTSLATSPATGYATGRPVGPVLSFARTAHRNGVAVLFNTGRWEGRDQLVGSSGLSATRSTGSVGAPRARSRWPPASVNGQRDFPVGGQLISSLVDS